MTTSMVSLLCGAFAFSVGSAQPSASGTLSVNGQTSKLNFARALQSEDWTFGADNKPVLATVTSVFIGDSTVDDLEDNFELGVRAKEGSLHGLLIRFSKKGELLGASLYHQAAATGVENMFTSRMLFRLKTLNTAIAGGTLKTAEPMDLTAGSLAVNTTFNASFQEQPKPTVQGPTAAETVQGKLAQEFIQAAEANNAQALMAIVRKEVVEMLKQPEGKEAVMGVLGMSYPNGKQIKIVRVFNFGNRAWVEGESQRQDEAGKTVDETYKIRLILENGKWKVSPL